MRQALRQGQKRQLRLKLKIANAAAQPYWVDNYYDKHLRLWTNILRHKGTNYQAHDAQYDVDELLALQYAIELLIEARLGKLELQDEEVTK